MKNKSIFKILIGDIKYDGRVRKEIRTLLDNGIEVTLFNFTPSENKDPFLNHPNFNYIYKYKKQQSFGMLNFFKIVSFNLLALNLIHKNKIKKIHMHDLNSTLLLLFFSPRKKNVQVIFDVHELFPETHYGVNNRIWSFIERKIVNKVNFFIFPEKNRLKYFQQKHSISNDKMILLENFPSKNDFNGFEVDVTSINTKNKNLKCLYIGHLMEDRGIEEIILSFKKLPQDELYIVGKGEKKYLEYLESLIEQKKLQTRVFLLEPIDNSDVVKFINKFDLGFAFYENTNLNNYYCASNKIYEFLSLNKVIVTNDYPGLIELKNQDSRVICIDNIDRETISKAILNLKNKELNHVEKTYFWESQSQKLLDVYNVKEKQTNVENWSCVTESR